MQYLYDGVLPELTAAAIKAVINEYPYVLELKSSPADLIVWIANNLKDYTSSEKKNMSSGTSTRTGKKYSVLTGPNSFFIFLYSKEEKEMVAKAFRDYVVSENPFKTMF